MISRFYRRDCGRAKMVVSDLPRDVTEVPREMYTDLMLKYKRALSYIDQARDTLEALNYETHICSECPHWEHVEDYVLKWCNECEENHCPECEYELHHKTPTA